jgi:peroxiredoxin
VDGVGQNRAMAEKLILPFSLLADEAGEVIRRYDVWDEEGQISRPATFVIYEGGAVRYKYVGEDFADRPRDQPIYDALNDSKKV